MEITHLILDVDGTLSDGGIYIGSDGAEYKKFQAKDGLIVRMLPTLGIKTIFMTGRNSELTNIRAEDLGISIVMQDVQDKPKKLSQLFNDEEISPASAAYIGDDLNDFVAMRLCGFKACPSDASEEIRGICDYVSTVEGGRGAVRDICEYILKRDGKYDGLLELFGVVKT